MPLSGGGHHDRFHEELQQTDVPSAARANRHTNPNLARPFGDRNESIIFIMPMPPTSREIEATAPSNIAMTRALPEAASAMSGEVTDENRLHDPAGF